MTADSALWPVPLAEREADPVGRAAGDAPDFALTFDPDAVHLMEREGEEWSWRGAARFDAADLPGRMAALRRLLPPAAAGRVALIIPDDQILYTTVAVPQGGPRAATVLRAMDGLTPYAVEDLALDWRDEGEGRVKVAAVWRQTLAEAEAFALRNGFEPALLLADTDGRELAGGVRFDHAPVVTAPAEGAQALAAELARGRPEASDAGPPRPEGDDMTPADTLEDAVSGGPATVSKEALTIAEADARGAATGPAAVEAGAAAGDDGDTDWLDDETAGATDLAASIARIRALSRRGVKPAALAEGAAAMPEDRLEAERALARRRGEVLRRQSERTAVAAALGADASEAGVLPELAPAEEPDTAVPLGAEDGGDAAAPSESEAVVTVVAAEAPSPAAEPDATPAEQSGPGDAAVRVAAAVEPRAAQATAVPQAQAGTRSAERGAMAEGGAARATPLSAGAPTAAPRLSQQPRPVARPVSPDSAVERPGRPSASVPARQVPQQAAGLRPHGHGGLAVMLGLLLIALLAAFLFGGGDEPQAQPAVLAEAGSAAAPVQPAEPGAAPPPVAPAETAAAAPAVSPPTNDQPTPSLPVQATLAPEQPEPAPVPTAPESGRATGAAQTPQPATPPAAERPEPVPSAPEPAAATPAAEAGAVTPAPLSPLPDPAPVPAPSEAGASAAAAIAPKATVPATPPQPDSAPAAPSVPEAAPPAPPPLTAVPPVARSRAIESALAEAVAEGEAAAPPSPQAPTSAARPSPRPARAAIRPEAAKAQPAPTPSAPRPAPRSGATATVPEGGAAGKAPAPRPAPAAAAPEAAAPASSRRPLPRPRQEAAWRADSPVPLRLALLGDSLPVGVERRLFAAVPAAAARGALRVHGPSEAALAGLTPETPLRVAQARPPKRDGASRSDAVTAAIGAAVGEAAPADPGPSAVRQSQRPLHRPAGGAAASPASASLLSPEAVEGAIAAAIDASPAPPGGIALSALRSSPLPPRAPARGGAGAAADAAAAAVGAAVAAAPRVAPEAAPAAPAPDADAAAQAERRRLDDELQAQAEARIRARAAADAKLEAGQRAAAEARARAQAAAEERAAAARRQPVRPVEIDDEPELAAAAAGGATTATVAASATVKGMDLNRTTLIGVIGAGPASRGLIRLRNGRIVTVRLGDRIDGGTITSIGNGRVTYVKGARPFELRILDGR